MFFRKLRSDTDWDEKEQKASILGMLTDNRNLIIDSENHVDAHLTTVICIEGSWHEILSSQSFSFQGLSVIIVKVLDKMESLFM